MAACRSYLGNFGPALTSIPHLLETQLLRWRPGSVCSALLCGRSLRRHGVVDRRSGLRGSSYRSGGGRHGHRCWGRRCLLSWNLSRLGRSRDNGLLGRRSLLCCRGGSGGSSSSTAALATPRGRRSRGRSRLWRRLLLDGLMLDLLRLNSSLGLVRHTMLLLNRLRLLRLLSDMRVLLLDMRLGVLRVLLGVLGVLRMLGVLRVLGMLRLLRGVLRNRHRGLDGARVLLMLLLMLLRRGLLGILTIIKAGVGAAIHVGLRLRVTIVLLLAVPVGVSGEGRLCLLLHRHRGLSLRGP